MMKHTEYSIYVRSPWQRGLCQFGVDCPWACKNDGSFAVEIVDDRDQVLLKYANVCEAHLLAVVIAQIVEH